MFLSIPAASNRRHFLRGFAFACALLAIPCALAQQRMPAATPPPPKGLRIFYASHSLMWYVPKLIPEVAAAAGIQGQEVVGVQAIGASRTLQHWEKGEPNEAKQALNTGKVDVFVMSPIQFPDEGIENFVKLGLEHNPNMRFIVQLSWGGGDTDNQDFPKGSWDNVDHNKTPEQIGKLYVRNIAAGQAQADEINKKYGKGKRILTLAPAAQALVALRTKIYKKEIPGLNSQGELFVDAVHPSAPLEVLNTYLHFAVLYGRSPVGLPRPASMAVITELRSERQAAWTALEQVHADFVLEILHLATQRGLRDMEPRRGFGEAQGFTDAHEVAEVTQFHRPALCRKGMATQGSRYWADGRIGRKIS